MEGVGNSVVCPSWVRLSCRGTAHPSPDWVFTLANFFVGYLGVLHLQSASRHYRAGELEGAVQG